MSSTTSTLFATWSNPFAKRHYALHRSLTILRTSQSPNAGTIDPSELALAALGWILEDVDRAERLLSLTGLTPQALREGIMTAHVQGAVLEYLANHEPDLVACAESLAITPTELISAQRELAS